MTGCGLPEVNPDAAIKLVTACGILSGVSFLSAIVSLLSKVSELKAKIKNAAGNDPSSGLPYQVKPEHQKLLAYRLSLRIYVLMAIGFVGILAVITYSIIATGDPRLLRDDLACAATWALWIALLCAGISPFPFVGFIWYILRLYKAADKVS